MVSVKFLEEQTTDNFELVTNHVEAAGKIDWTNEMCEVASRVIGHVDGLETIVATTKAHTIGAISFWIDHYICYGRTRKDAMERVMEKFVETVGVNTVSWKGFFDDCELDVELFHRASIAIRAMGFKHGVLWSRMTSGFDLYNGPFYFFIRTGESHFFL